MKLPSFPLNTLALLVLALPPSSVASPPDSTFPTDDWLATGLGEISSERMLADIKTLSGPTFRGRQTGTVQDRESAAFVTDRFGMLLLHRTLAPFPLNQTNPLPQREWEQTMPVPVTVIDDRPFLRIGFAQARPPHQTGKDFLPVLDSPSADLQAPVVFVGYGLSDPSQGIDDYAGVDVRDKIVLFLRGKPDKFTGSAGHADKERLAKTKGAAGYFTATGPILSAYEQRRGVTGRPSAFYSTADSADRLPGAWISTELAEAILLEGTNGTNTLRGLQEDLHRTGLSRSTVLDINAQLQWESHSTTGTLFNVASAIRSSSTSSGEAVIIGAHRDHFGQQAGLLFAGADDNASGTAVLLEVARVLASSPITPKRSILFLSFSGEEQGLLGSKLYVSQPMIPLPNTVAMINVDHAGIGNGRLTVGVTGFEKTAAVEAGRLAGLTDRVDVFGFFPGGDHVPFKEAGVPTVTVVSGGGHPHFHQPLDTAETIDPAILQAAARYVLAMAWQLANQP